MQRVYTIFADPALPKTAIESSRKSDRTIPSMDRFQYHVRERKGLVTLGRLLCATLRLLRRKSDWLWSHDFELTSMCETTELEDHLGKVSYPH